MNVQKAEPEPSHATYHPSHPQTPQQSPRLPQMSVRKAEAQLVYSGYHPSPSPTSTVWASNGWAAEPSRTTVLPSLLSGAGSGSSTSPHAGSATSSLGSPGIVASPVPPPAEPPVNSSVPRRPRPTRAPSAPRPGPAFLPPLPNVLPAAPPQHIDLSPFIVDDGDEGGDGGGPLPPMSGGGGGGGGGGGAGGGAGVSPMATPSPGVFGVSAMPISPLQPFSAGVRGDHEMQDSPYAAPGSASNRKQPGFW
jgi:hypothetical protein